MPRIIVDASELRRLAHLLWADSQELGDVQRELDSALNISSWEGANRAEAEGHWHGERARLGLLAAQAEEMARFLERKAAAFELADRESAQLLGAIGPASTSNWVRGWPQCWAGPALGIGSGGIAGLGLIASPPGAIIGPEPHQQRWVRVGPDIEYAEDGSRVAGISHDLLDEVRYADYRSVGRFLNVQTGDLRGGWVGRMDRIGHVIRSPAVHYGLPIVGGVIAYATNDDPNRYRALGTAAVETGLEFAIGAAGGGGVLVANAGVQLFGELAEASAAQMAHTYGGEWGGLFMDQSASLDDNFDRADLGNVTHDIAHIAVDLFADPSRVSTDWNDLATHVTDLPVGLGRAAIDTVSLTAMQDLASFDGVVTSLPLPSDWQTAIHGWSVDSARWIEDLV